MPGQRSWHSNWLWAGQPRGQSSSPSEGKNFHLSMSFRLAPGPTQPPIHWVLGALSLGLNQMEREADHSTATSAKVKET
jgi:hypothetical protein